MTAWLSAAIAASRDHAKSRRCISDQLAIVQTTALPTWIRTNSPAGSGTGRSTSTPRLTIVKATDATIMTNVTADANKGKTCNDEPLVALVPTCFTATASRKTAGVLVARAGIESQPARQLTRALPRIVLGLEEPEPLCLGHIGRRPPFGDHFLHVVLAGWTAHRAP